jgi:hypothetical protein
MNEGCSGFKRCKKTPELEDGGTGQKTSSAATFPRHGRLRRQWFISSSHLRQSFSAAAIIRLRQEDSLIRAVLRTMLNETSRPCSLRPRADETPP